MNSYKIGDYAVDTELKIVFRIELNPSTTAALKLLVVANGNEGEPNGSASNEVVSNLLNSELYTIIPANELTKILYE